VVLQWLWSAISSGAESIVLALLNVVGTLFNVVLEVVLKDVIMPILKATVFAPFSLSGTGCVGGGTACEGHIISAAFQTAWHFMALASGGVALVMLAWAAMRAHLGAVSGSTDKASVVEGLVVWGAVLVGGQWFFVTMLDVANAITVQLVGYAENVTQMIPAASASGAAGAVAAALVYFFGEIALLALVAVLLWVIGVWIWRQIELVLYTSLLPVLAALSIGGNKQTFQWGWNEAVGALFSQLAMAVAFFIAFLLLRNYPLPSGTPQGTQLGISLLHMGIGGFAFALVAKAPSMLSNITGHRHAGFGAIAGGVMAGTLMARGAQTAMRMTRGGAALHRIAQAKEQESERAVASWADRKTVGERIFGSGDQRTMVGRRVDSALASVRATAQRAGEAGMSTNVGMGLALAAESWPGRQVMAGGKAVGRAALGVAGQVTGKARSVASYAIQPRTTLGRDLTRSYGAEGVAESEIGREGFRRIGAETEAFNAQYAAKHPNGPEDPEYGKHQSAMLRHEISLNRKTGEVELGYVFRERLHQFHDRRGNREGNQGTRTNRP